MMRVWIKAVWCFLFSIQLAFAATDVYSFQHEKDQRRFNELTHELRCLVCQNQSLADSDATLASDLRHKIYVMIHEGKTDAEIKDYLTSRYGAFILFSPPFNWVTSLLWLFPSVLILVIFGGILLKKRKPKAML